VLHDDTQTSTISSPSAGVKRRNVDNGKGRKKKTKATKSKTTSQFGGGRGARSGGAVNGSAVGGGLECVRHLDLHPSLQGNPHGIGCVFMDSTRCFHLTTG